MNYPRFVNSQTYYSIDKSKSDIDQLVNLTEILKKINVLTTSNFDSFDELIQKFLSTGVRIFGLEFGIVSKIEGDEYTVCNAVSPDNIIKKGDVFTLEGTYCREVYKSKQIIGFPHVGQLEELKGHPVYINMKLESYLSAPIYFEGEIYGTLNFSSTRVRDHGFSEVERDLIGLMANAIGAFLENEAKEQKLIQANDRMKQLVGIVAHDLRNPLGNIISVSDIFSELEDDEKNEMLLAVKSSAESALEMVHSILEMAAMGMGKIELKLVSCDLSQLVETVHLRYQALAQKKNLTIDLDMDKECSLNGDINRLTQVIDNLISNAIKYSLPDSRINLSCKNNGKMVDFRLENKKSASSSSTSFNVESSVGIGLELVREILQLHHSELEIEQSGDMYVAFFSIRK
tara:strand:- start:23242 stop:24447 length:1206 start_codon:yes stop_codon:yes gene_type:complete